MNYTTFNFNIELFSIWNYQITCEVLPKDFLS